MAADTRLAAGSFALAWLAAFVAIIVLDGICLGLVAKDMYQREMGSLMADPVRVVPIVAFHLLFPIALVYLTLFNEPSGWTRRSCAAPFSAWPPTAPTTSPTWRSCATGRSASA